MILWPHLEINAYSAEPLLQFWNASSVFGTYRIQETHVHVRGSLNLGFETAASENNSSQPFPQQDEVHSLVRKALLFEGGFESTAENPIWLADSNRFLLRKAQFLCNGNVMWNLQLGIAEHSIEPSAKIDFVQRNDASFPLLDFQDQAFALAVHPGAEWLHMFDRPEEWKVEARRKRERGRTALVLTRRKVYYSQDPVKSTFTDELLLDEASNLRVLRCSYYKGDHILTEMVFHYIDMESGTDKEPGMDKRPGESTTQTPAAAPNGADSWKATFFREPWKDDPESKPRQTYEANIASFEARGAIEIPREPSFPKGTRVHDARTGADYVAGEGK